MSWCGLDRYLSPTLSVGCLLLGGLLVAAEPDAAQVARDSVVVETLLRLPGYDLNANPKLKESVLRHLAQHRGMPRFVELAEKLNLRDAAEELARLAAADPESTLGVQAAGLLLKFEERALVQRTLEGPDMAAAGLATALGFVGSDAAFECLAPLVTTDRSLSVRSAAARALGRSKKGQRRLLDLVTEQRLPEDLNFTVANALLGSVDDALRAEAAKHLKLPATAGAAPLPPVAELAKRSGDGALGKAVFETKGTCIKCHKVRGEGKEVGPDLSEIGGKLSREAMYVSILDPSAGISHNYETHVLALENGNILAGIIISETADKLELKTSESIVHSVTKSQIEERRKSPLSLMPADLQKNLTVDDLLNVVEYLTTLRK